MNTTTLPTYTNNLTGPDPHLLYRSVTCLRDHARCPRQGRPGSSNRISLVRLPDLAAVLTVRAINLNHQNLVIVEEPDKTDTPRPGALNTHHLDLTMRCEPPK